MKKRLLSILSVTLVVSLAFGAYYLFFSNISEKRYNKIMCYYIARNFTEGCENFNDKITALRDFVHENVLPIHGYPNRLDTCAIEKLTSGIGWCDQQSRVFMQLARSIGITSRLLFLRLESGSSPHSIAEVLTPDGRWVIVDVMYKLDLINKEGDLATQTDIKKDISIIADNERVKQRVKFEKRWADPVYLAIYYNPPEYITIKEGVKVDFLKFVPLQIIKPLINIIQDKYFSQIKPRIGDMYEFKLIEARGYHLLGYHAKADRLYNEVIKNSSNLALIRKSQYYFAILLKEQERYREAHQFLSQAISQSPENNPYRGYLLGLRARILEKMGRSEEAEKDLLEIQYSLQA